MARGLDLYQRYNTVRNWQAVKAAGCSWVWLKVTDGFGKAIVAADAYTRGAKSVGIPVGGYHFAQKGDPRRQARVFADELNRLGAVDIIPALDIESNEALDLHWGATEGRDFSIQFLQELRRFFPRVALYSSTSELKAFRALDICNQVPDTVVWEANFSSNNGVRHSLPTNNWAPFRGAHQFTSNGRWDGIDGAVDVNESFVDLTMEGDDVALSDADVIRVADAVWAKQLPNLDPGPGKPDSLPAGVLQYGSNMGAWGAREEAATEGDETQAQLAAAVDRLETKFTGLLTQQQAALLAAFDERPTSVDMTEENVQQLLAGMSAATVKAFRDIAQDILMQTDEEEN